MERKPFAVTKVLPLFSGSLLNDRTMTVEAYVAGVHLRTWTLEFLRRIRA